MAAIENLESLLARGQESALLRYSLGSEHLKLEDYVRAEIHLTQAVRLDPSYSAAWKLLGKSLAGLGRHREAVDAFDRGIEAAERKGDLQAAKEMRVFRKRSEKAVET